MIIQKNNIGKAYYHYTTYKNKKYCFFKIFFMILFLLTLYGCDKSYEKMESKEDISKKDDNKIHVGFCMATLKEDRWLKDKDLFVALAQEKGIEVEVKNAVNDSKAQYKQVRELIRNGIDVLVIVPTDSNCDDTRECVRMAQDAGVGVIYYDRFITNAGTDNAQNVYVAFDNEKVGNLMGEYILNQVPKGNYIVCNGPKNDYSSVLINKGYMECLDDSIKKGDVNILGETWITDWTKEEAKKYVKKIAQDENDVDAIICANDAYANEALEALSILRMDTNKIGVVSQDADLLACRRIVEKKQIMTVYKPVRKLVEATLDVCIKMVKKEKIDKPNGGYIDDGTFDIPYIKVDVTAVTKDNIDDTVIKDCYHLKESIYENESQEKIDDK